MKKVKCKSCKTDLFEGDFEGFLRITCPNCNKNNLIYINAENKLNSFLEMKADN